MKFTTEDYDKLRGATLRHIDTALRRIQAEARKDQQ